MIIAKCNRCGKEIEKLHCYRYVGISLTTEKFAFSGSPNEFELCDDCHQVIQEIFVGPVIIKIKEKSDG